MSELLEMARMVWARALALWLDPRVLGSALAVLATVAVAVPLRHGRAGWRRLWARGARTDLLYTAFYLGGFYAFFVSGPMYRLLAAVVDRWAPGARLNVMAPWPPWLQFLVASVVFDAILYFVHRLSHRNRWLWAFHSVHHSQSDLTPLANFRFHFVDASVKGLLQFPAGLLLGVPAGVWTVTIWVQVALDALAHSGLAWEYGPLGRVLVSPGFHRLHHSAEERHRDRNFGLSYSFWDRLFGTAAPDDGEPAAYGAPELHVPESITGQLAYPFVVLTRPPHGS
jgi:sterol desaturase/sphingolipid hydroxylase (fatty acid hydroxylase superfamily)